MEVIEFVNNFTDCIFTGLGRVYFINNEFWQGYVMVERRNPKKLKIRCSTMKFAFY